LKITENDNHDFGPCRTEKGRIRHIYINNKIDFERLQGFALAVYERKPLTICRDGNISDRGINGNCADKFTIGRINKYFGLIGEKKC
jgi:hypothetical protein